VQIHWKRAPKRVNELHDPKGLWSIHTYLTEKLRETDRKYDYRYAVLFFVFGRLLYEGWVTIEDLKGLSEDKIEAMKRISTLSTEEWPERNRIKPAEADTKTIFLAKISWCNAYRLHHASGLPTVIRQNTIVDFQVKRG
jgi:hypothetical protein